MSWLFSQALVEEFSEVSSSDGEPSAQLNVMPTARPFWRNDKTMEPSRLSRFGLTLRLLTAGRGEELLTSYLAGFRAKTSVLRAAAKESTDLAQGSGAIRSGWFVKYNPQKCGWRTAQRSLLEDWEEFSETWPRRGMTQSGRAYLLPDAESIRSETESGYVPTPTACDHKGSGRLRLELGPNNNLRDFCKINFGLLYPPVAAVEWLMWWPAGWTDLKPLETAKFQEWRQQHGGC